MHALRAQKIDVIVLKGAFLAQAAYENMGKRPMSDIDLLVKRADLKRTESLLIDLNFGPLPRRPLNEQCSSGNHHLDGFLLKDTLIEIHWLIEHQNTPFRINYDELWLRARQFTLEGETVSALSLEDLILHLCLNASFNHGEYHYENGLRAFCDIAVIVERFNAEINWENVRSRAREWRIGNCVYLTLRLSNHLVNAGVPNEVLNALAPPSFDLRIDSCAISLSLRNITLREHNKVFYNHFPSFEQVLLDARLCPWSFRKTLLAALFPSDEMLATLYPNFQWPGFRYIARIVRWKDILTECVRYYSFPNAQMKPLAAIEKERFRLALWLLGVNSSKSKPFWWSLRNND